MKMYENIYKQYQKQWKSISHFVKLSDQLFFKLDFQKWNQHAGGKWLIHSTRHVRTIDCKAQNSSMEYSCWEYIKQSDGNMFNQVS